MARFNPPKAKQRTKTENLAGGEALLFRDTRLELASLVLTSFVQDQFYRSAAQGVAEVHRLVGESKDKEFVAKLAVFARTKYGMRSISHVLAGELLATRPGAGQKNIASPEWMRSFLSSVIYRPDDITEIVSYFKSHYAGRPLPNVLKKGVSDALGRFDAYRLAKYRGDGKGMKMVDVVNLCHPQKAGNAEVIQALVEDRLRSDDTWESMLSAAGSATDPASAKAQVWRSLLAEAKLPYFALLRNLRNIAEQAPDVLPLALVQLVDERQIKKSLVLPFRFTTAAKEFEATPRSNVIEALSLAAEISLDNIPKLPGKTLVPLDVSCSMQGKPAEIGSLFAAALVKGIDADLITFETSARYVSFNRRDSLLTLAKSFRFPGGGTNFRAIFQTANQPYDRVIILSDMQGWIGHDTPTKALAEYERRTGAKPFIHSFDLQGYGTLQFPQDRVACLAGFSEKVFDVMPMLEQDKMALVREIEKTTFAKVNSFAETEEAV